MKKLLLALSLSLAAGCATTVPDELRIARDNYRRASTGPAAQIAPVELHAAQVALQAAETSFDEDSDSYHTKDLAYVAQRKSELAEATASITIEKQNQANAKDQFQKTQTEVIGKTKDELATSKTELATSERAGEASALKLGAEQQARAAADQRAATAQLALAKLAAVREEPRGMVITLSGSVLFASDKSELLPAARNRLEQVAEVLLASPDRSLTIEGHTDSRGGTQYNIDLSQRRADAVRNELVRRGYPTERIESRGLGAAQPVSENNSADGRANNRRVEIVVRPEVHSSNEAKK